MGRVLDGLPGANRGPVPEASARSHPVAAAMHAFATSTTLAAVGRAVSHTTLIHDASVAPRRTWHGLRATPESLDCVCATSCCVPALLCVANGTSTACGRCHSFIYRLKNLWQRTDMSQLDACQNPWGTGLGLVDRCGVGGSGGYATPQTLQFYQHNASKTLQGQ